jgi:hypothetical protein
MPRVPGPRLRPFRCARACVYLEDEATRGPVTELMACPQLAEPAIRPASVEDSRAYSTPTAGQDE